MANEPGRNPEQNQPGQGGKSQAPGRNPQDDQEMGKREGAGAQGDAADRADREVQNLNNPDVE